MALNFRARKRTFFAEKHKIDHSKKKSFKGDPYLSSTDRYSWKDDVQVKSGSNLSLPSMFFSLPPGVQENVTVIGTQIRKRGCLKTDKKGRSAGFFFFLFQVSESLTHFNCVRERREKIFANAKIRSSLMSMKNLEVLSWWHIRQAEIKKKKSDFLLAKSQKTGKRKKGNLDCRKKRTFWAWQMPRAREEGASSFFLAKMRNIAGKVKKLILHQWVCCSWAEAVAAACPPVPCPDCRPPRRCRRCPPSGLSARRSSGSSSASRGICCLKYVDEEDMIIRLQWHNLYKAYLVRALPVSVFSRSPPPPVWLARRLQGGSSLWRTSPKICDELQCCNIFFVSANVSLIHQIKISLSQKLLIAIPRSRLTI